MSMEAEMTTENRQVLLWTSVMFGAAIVVALIAFAVLA